MTKKPTLTRFEIETLRDYREITAHIAQLDSQRSTLDTIRQRIGETGGNEYAGLLKLSERKDLDADELEAITEAIAWYIWNLEQERYSWRIAFAVGAVAKIRP